MSYPEAKTRQEISNLSEKNSGFVLSTQPKPETSVIVSSLGLERKVEFSEADILTRFETIPPENPWVLHLQELADTYMPDQNLQITILNDDRISAFVLPNGKMYITKGLIQQLPLETEEEELALQFHEAVHVSEDHVNAILKKPHTLFNPLAKLGTERIHEIEADLRAAQRMDDAGRNPEGLIRLLEKFREKIEARDIDSNYTQPVHGSLTDRILNLREIGRLENARNLNQPQTPISLSPDLLDTEPTDSDRWNNIYSLTPQELRWFVPRQIRRLQNQLSQPLTPQQEEEIKNKLVKLVEIGSEKLVSKQLDQLPPHHHHKLLYLIFALGFNLRQTKDIEVTVRGKRVDLPTDAFIQSFQSKEDIQVFSQILESNVLDEMALLIEPYRLAQIQTEILFNALSQDAFLSDSDPKQPDFKTYVESGERLAQACSQVTKKQGTDKHQLFHSNIAIAGYDHVYEHSQDKQNTAMALAVECGKLDININDITHFIVKRHQQEYDRRNADSLTRIEPISLGYQSPANFSLSQPLSAAFIATLEKAIGQQIRNLPSQLEQYKAIFNSGAVTLTRFENQTLLTLLNKHSLRDIANQLFLFEHKLIRPEEERSFYFGTFPDAMLDIAFGKLTSLIHSDVTQESESASQYKDYYDEDDYSPSDQFFQNTGVKQEELEMLERKRRKQIEDAPIIVSSVSDSLQSFLRFLDDNLPNLFVEESESLSGFTRLLSNFERTIIARNNKLPHQPQWQLERQDLQRMPTFLKALKFSLITKLAKTRPRTAISVLESTVSKYPLYRVEGEQLPSVITTDISSSPFDEEEFSTFSAEVYLERKAKAFSRLSRESWNSSEEADLRSLFLIGIISEDTQVLYQLPRAAAKRLVENLSFKQALEFINQEFGHLPSVVFSDAYNYLTEHKARSPQEFEALLEIQNTRIAESTRMRDSLGSLAVADTLANDYFENSEELLINLLQTGEDDRPLKQMLSDYWYHSSKFMTEWSHFSLSRLLSITTANNYQQKRWINNLIPAGVSSYRPLNSVMRALYLADSPMKYLMLRKILMGKHGVLRSQDKKQRLTDTFISEFIELNGDESAEQKTRQAIEAIMSVDNLDDLYLHLNPLLMLNILNIPETESGYQEAAAQVVKNEVSRLIDSSDAVYGPLRDLSDYNLVLAEEKIRNLMIGRTSDDSQQAEDQAPERGLLSLFPQKKDNGKEGKYSPLELLIELGERTPAGAKALQRIIQYAPIPEGERKQFLRIYDRVRSQSRLTVYRTLKQEAKISEEIRQFIDQIDYIGEELGEGSLFKVLEVGLKNGRKEALAAVAPNAEYNTAKTIGFYREVVVKLREKEPKNRTYSLLDSLLDDLMELVARELNDHDYDRKTSRFREVNDSRLGYKPGTKYQILVPESYPTGTLRVYREELMEGTNLTELDIVEGKSDIENGKISREDFKAVTSTLVRNFRHQMSSGLVHSDYSPGQLRISNDNSSIAILDRRNLIELTPKEQKFFRSLETQAALGRQKVAKTFISFLFEIKANQHLRAEQKSISGEIIQAVKENPDDEFTIIRKAKELGLKVPLHIAQIFNNLSYLNSLASEAGFSNLVQALLHKG